MCGIIACLSQANSYTICINGLKQLQNRGYDSAGIASLVLENDNSSTNEVYDIQTTKYASTESVTAIERLDVGQLERTNISIAHTRWATHGAKTDKNSHPHTYDKFSIVHNGIIENYATLKKFLISEDFMFISETDTEVIVNMISYYYSKPDTSVLMAIQKALSKLEGTWGLAIICKDEPDKLYCTRHGSPLLVGCTDFEALVVSEQSAFCGSIPNYFILQNGDICTITLNMKNDFSKKIDISTNHIYSLKKSLESNNALTPSPWPHWMIKEINEQPDVCLRALSLGGRLLKDDQVKLGGLNQYKDDLLAVNHIIILGCGTSYNAGIIGRNFLRDICDFDTVQLLDGAEFSSKDIPKSGNTALLFLSQSGETKDLHRCISIGKEHNLLSIGVVNVVDSLIAREVNCGCYLNAGREVAVASTKAYTAQIVVMSLISIWFAQEKGINENKRKQYIRDLRNLPMDMKTTIDRTSEQIISILPQVMDSSSIFLLGKGNGESVAREGALKIKEVAYIHAEGCNTSSLKHGPFALLTKNFPVILISPNNEFYVKNENAYEELKSREANVVFITDKENCDKKHILISNNTTFQDCLGVVPLQLIAYQIGLKVSPNPDMPRNLAKVVTVE